MLVGPPAFKWGRMNMTYTSVQPDENLLVGIHVRRGEEPEKQVVAIRVCRYGNRTSIALTNVEVNIRNPGAVDRELYYNAA